VLDPAVPGPGAGACPAGRPGQRLRSWTGRFRLRHEPR